MSVHEGKESLRLCVRDTGVGIPEEEIGRLGKQLGVDAREVMRLLCLDTRLNISPAYLRPGFAFGGSCLPKELRALLYLAKQADVELPMLANVLSSNKVHIEHALAHPRSRPRPPRRTPARYHRHRR